MSQNADNTSGQTGQHRWRGIVQIAVILALVAIALYFARAPDRTERDVGLVQSTEESKPVVRVVHPTRTVHTHTVNLTGTVSNSERVSIRSEIVGKVTWVSPEFNAGGWIEANERIVQIDPKEFELRVKHAEARANAGVVGAQAELELAKLQLSRTNISLPFPTRVLWAQTDVGELVGPDLSGRTSLLGVVYRFGSLQVVAPIELKNLKSLDPIIGRSAQVEVQGELFSTTVERVSASVSASSRLARVFLRFAKDIESKSLPLPGTFATVAIEGPSFEEVYILPEASLQANESVWMVRDSTLRRFEPKTIGRVQEGWVVDAFDTGEGVVVGKLPDARNGMAVALAQTGSLE